MQLTKNIYEVKERLPTERVCKFDPNKRVIDLNILPMRKDRVITYYEPISIFESKMGHSSSCDQREAKAHWISLSRGLGGPKAMWSQLQRTS